MISKIKKLIYALLFVLLFSFLYIWQNNYIVTSYYNYENSRIPESFDNFKILQISDWHNTDFGSQLVNKIHAAKPDIIILTGDFLDVYHPDEYLAYNLLNELTSKYPVYFITGNHEVALFKKNYQIKQNLRNLDVVFLENESINITENNEAITIYGIKDYSRNKNVKYDLNVTIDKQNPNFSILLAHQPQYFEEYAKHNVDLIFSGHEHGGQIRFPYIGSIYSHQGWFADWTDGMHTLNNSTMIVSRGLGNSELLPIRVFNQPELVLTTLVRTEK